jgi:uncharacterized protein involved in exopolysaccharide biosynthesis
VANALATSYVDENSKIRERQAAGTAQLLRAQLGELKRRLDQQEHQIGLLPAPAEAEIAGLERLIARLRFYNDQQLRLLDRRDRMAREPAEVPAAPAAPGAPVTPDPTGAKLRAMKQELAELRTRYTDKYPDVIRLRSEIAALEALAPARPEPPPAAPATPAAPPKPARNPLAEIDAELKALKDEERGLRASIAAYEGRMESAPRRLQDFQRRARDYTTTKEMYDSMLKRYEDAQLAETMEQRQRGEQFRVLDQAVPPREPVAPNRLRLAVVALAVSIGLGIAAVMLAERLDTSFHTVDDLRAFTRLPVLTGIAPLVSARDMWRRRRRFGLAAASLTAVLALAVTASYLFAHGNEPLARLLAGGW